MYALVFVGSLGLLPLLGWVASLSLEENLPQAFNSMTPAERKQMADEVDQSARESEASLLEQMLAKSPGPSDSLGKMAHVEQLQRSAREIILDGVMVKEPEEVSETSPGETID